MRIFLDIPVPFLTCAYLHHCRLLVLKAFEDYVSVTPLDCGLPICVVVVSFLCVGQSRICSLSHVLVCVCVHQSTEDVSSVFSVLRRPQLLSLSMMSVVLATFLLGAMLVPSTSQLVILLLAVPQFSD